MGQRKKVKRRPIGILDMLIAQAHDVPNRMPSNGPYTPRQDVYVQVFGGRTPSKQNLKTRKAKEGGSEPVFNETMQVCILEGDVELTCQVWMASYSRGSHLDVMLAYAHISLESFLHDDPCRKLKTFALINSEKPNESGGVISLGLKFHPSNVSALDRQAETQGCTPSRPTAAIPAQPSLAQPAVRQDGSLLASLRAALGRHTADSENNGRGSKRSSPEPACDDTPLIFIAGSCDLSGDDNEGLEKYSDRMLKKGRPLGLDIEAELKKVVGEIVIPKSEDGESNEQSSAKGSPWSQSEVLQGSQFQRESVLEASVGAPIQTTVRVSPDLRFGSLTIPDLDFECEESPRSRRNLSSREKKVLEDLKIGQRGEVSNSWQKDLDSPGVLCFWGETEQVIDGGLEEVLNLPKAGGGIGMEEADPLESVFEFDFHSYANHKDSVPDVSFSMFGEGEYVMESCESIGSVKHSNLSFGSEGELEGKMIVLASQVVMANPVTPVSEKSASQGQRQLLWQRRIQKNERKRGEGGHVKEGKRRCNGVRGQGECWQTLDNAEAMGCTASTLQEQYSRNLTGREIAP